MVRVCHGKLQGFVSRRKECIIDMIERCASVSYDFEGNYILAVPRSRVERSSTCYVGGIVHRGTATMFGGRALS